MSSLRIALSAPIMARLRPVPSAPIAAIPGAWIATGLAISSVILAFMLARAQIVVDPFAPGNRSIIVSVGLIAFIGYALRDPRDLWQRIARDYCEYFGAFVLICLMGAVASYPAAAASHGFADIQLERVDHLFRFDWLAWYNLVAAHPWLQRAEGLAYDSIYVTPAVVLGFLAVDGKGAEARLFLAAFWFAAILTLLSFQLLPAVGPLAFLDHHHVTYMPASGLYQAELIPLLRNHAFHQIDLGALHGLVCAPSFHTTSAILYMWAAWPLRWLRWPAMAANLAMLLATPVEGTHYLADMIAGGAVALLSLTAMTVFARWLADRAPVAERAPPRLTLVKQDDERRLAA